MQFRPTRTVKTLLLSASAVDYVGAVSVRMDRWFMPSDVRDMVWPHVTVYFLLLNGGLWLGMATGGSLLPVVQAVTQAMLPGSTEASRTATVRAISAAVVATGVLSAALWTVLSWNLFIDGHRGVMAEEDVALYLMGALTGVAWHALLDSRWWLGLWLTPAMALMVAAHTLSRFAWM